MYLYLYWYIYIYFICSSVFDQERGRDTHNNIIKITFKLNVT